MPSPPARAPKDYQTKLVGRNKDDVVSTMGWEWRKSLMEEKYVKSIPSSFPYP